MTYFPFASRGHGSRARAGAWRLAAGIAVLVVASSCAAARPAVVLGPLPAATPTTAQPAKAAMLAAVASPAIQVSDATTTTTTTTAPTTVAAEAPTTAPATTEAPVPTTAAPVPTMVTEVAPLVAPLDALRPGASGDAVRVLQQRLIDLGFWIDEVDGDYGYVTTQAVMAFQKFYGSFYVLQPSGTADAATVQVLRSITSRPRGYAKEGDLVEVDKSRQVLFIVRAGATQWILNTSTGSGKTYTETNQKDGGEITGTAITPEGDFKVYREYSDGWEKGQLGELYRPKYFKGGVAVHGLSSVPNYPASHGCVRVSLAAMDWIWTNDLMPHGTEVWVHSDASL